MYVQESLQFGKKPDKITFFIHPTEVACHPPSTNLKCDLCHQCHQVPPNPFPILGPFVPVAQHFRCQEATPEAEQQTENPSRRKLTKEFKPKKSQENNFM